MGMTIEEAKCNLSMQKFYKLGKDYEAVQVAIETMRKYQKMQADYEARLKADMVAMLTEIQLDIQEVNTAPQFLTDDNVKDFRECVDTIIQLKINALKEGTDGNR